MRNKVLNRFFIPILTAIVFFAFVGALQAQPRASAKPNDRAKKLAAAGDQFFNQKDYRAAINKYAEAIVASPNFPAAHYWKGYAHYYLNEFDASAEDLDAAYNQGYPRLDIYKIRWYVNFQIKNFDAALNDVQQGLKLEPNNTNFIAALGDIYFNKQDYKNAIDSYKKSLQLDPNNGDVHYFLARSYAGAGDASQQGLSAIEAIKKNTKYVGEAYMLVGDALVISKKPDEAIQAYERALNVKPDTPQEVYEILSGLYQGQGRINEAIATARKGVKLYPNDGNLFTNLTWYYSLADRPLDAVNVGQQAVKLLPNDQMAHTNLCRAYNDTKNYQQAILSCNNALRINANDGETNFYLARAYDFQNKPDVATQYYKKAVDGLLATANANPENSDAWYLLGNAYYADGQRDKAIEAYKKNLQLSPNFSKTRVNLGYMYFLNNNLTAAREQYDTLLKTDPQSAEKLKQLMDKK